MITPRGFRRPLNQAQDVIVNADLHDGIMSGAPSKDAQAYWDWLDDRELSDFPVGLLALSELDNDLDASDWGIVTPFDGNLTGATDVEEALQLLDDLNFIAAGGNDTEIQYNNGGTLAGISPFVWDGTTLNIDQGTYLGFGGVPESSIHIQGTSQEESRVTVERAGSANENPTYVDLKRSRGSLLSPAAVQQDDILGRLRFFGHDGSAYVDRSRIEARATESWDTNDTESDLGFFVGRNDESFEAMTLSRYELQLEEMGNSPFKLNRDAASGYTEMLGNYVGGFYQNSFDYDWDDNFFGPYFNSYPFKMFEDYIENLVGLVNSSERTITSDDTGLKTDYDVKLDGSSASVDYEVPQGSERVDGMELTITCVDQTNACRVTFGADTFYDSNSPIRLYKKEQLRIRFDGNIWIYA